MRTMSSACNFAVNSRLATTVHGVPEEFGLVVYFGLAFPESWVELRPVRVKQQLALTVAGPTITLKRNS
jgi:hypothetical protein